jgi:hypothetical protein
VQKIRRLAAFVLAVAALVVGVGLATSQSTPASASAPAVYSQSSRTETIYGGGRCIHTHSRTVRYYGWKTKVGHYVLLAKPSVTVSDSYKCHA